MSSPGTPNELLSAPRARPLEILDNLCKLRLMAAPPPGGPADLLLSTDLAGRARLLHELPTDWGPATSEIGKNITRERQFS